MCGVSEAGYNEVFFQELATFRDSIVISISACHADDPGSIPGRGDFIFEAFQYFFRSFSYAEFEVVRCVSFV